MESAQASQKDWGGEAQRGEGWELKILTSTGKDPEKEEPQTREVEVKQQERPGPRDRATNTRDKPEPTTE